MQQWNTKGNVSVVTVMPSTVEELWEAVSSVDPCGGFESAVSSWETDSSEVVADSRRWWRRERQRIVHCFKSLRSNAESTCEIGAIQRGQERLNTEAEKFTALEAVIRQLEKT
jgi:hypothetical protein